MHRINDGENDYGIFRRLMTLTERDGLGSDERFEHNDGRAAEAALLDSAIEEWTTEYDLAEF